MIKYSYDSACEILAEYFLGQPRDPEHVKALAQHVQQAVEDWFVDKNGWFVPVNKPTPLPMATERTSLAWAQVVNKAVEALIVIALFGMLTYCVTSGPAPNPCGALIGERE